MSASAKTTLDRYGHLMPNLENDAARRLEKTVFGNFVRKLLENPVSEGFPRKKETPEVVEPQGPKFGSGGRICDSAEASGRSKPATFGL